MGIILTHAIWLVNSLPTQNGQENLHPLGAC